ncbi:hypothetical protein D3C73_1034880 [compost metagenome]
MIPITAVTDERYGLAGNLPLHFLLQVLRRTNDHIRYRNPILLIGLPIREIINTIINDRVRLKAGGDPQHFTPRGPVEFFLTVQKGI